MILISVSACLHMWNLNLIWLQHCRALVLWFWNYTPRTLDWIHCWQNCELIAIRLDSNSYNKSHMHINSHIRSHELIERDFPHFPIIIWCTISIRIFAALCCINIHSFFQKLTAQANSDCAGTWRALTMPTPTRIALQFPQIKRYHLQRNNFTKPQKVRVWAGNRCVSRPLHFM